MIYELDHCACFLFAPAWLINHVSGRELFASFEQHGMNPMAIRCEQDKGVLRARTLRYRSATSETQQT